MIKCFAYLRFLISLLIFIFIISSCENNIEVIKNLGNVKDLPSATVNDIEILYSDSAKVKMKIVAPLLNKYTLLDNQYIEFPKGITVYQYDSAMNVDAMIRCNFAIFHELTKIWETRNDVVVKNLKKKEQLNTEELFWDQQKHIIYSKKYTRFTSENELLAGDDFKANEDLSSMKLMRTKGFFNIPDSTNETETP